LLLLTLTLILSSHVSDFLDLKLEPNYKLIAVCKTELIHGFMRKLWLNCYACVNGMNVCHCMYKNNKQKKSWIPAQNFNFRTLVWLMYKQIGFLWLNGSKACFKLMLYVAWSNWLISCSWLNQPIRLIGAVWFLKNWFLYILWHYHRIRCFIYSLVVFYLLEYHETTIC